MRVTLIIEVDAEDTHGKTVGTMTTQVELTDDHRVDAADLVEVYDAYRHNMLVELHEKGLTPTWDYPVMYGTPSRPSRDPRERSYRELPSTDPIEPPAVLTAGTEASLEAAQDAL